MIRTFAAILALTALPISATAASSGLAWDAVMKFSMDADPSSLQPGSFDSDFAAAAAVQAPDQGGGGGIFNQMHKAAAMAQAMQQMMKTGTAEHHYLAGSKERIDRLAFQTATIVDCAARTITTLDLRKKTYRVVSMDASPGPSTSGGSAPQPRATDTGTKVAIVIANKALGARDVGGQPTIGFSTETSFTETQPSGQSQSYNGDLVGYYSSYVNPAPSCSRPGIAAPSVSSLPNGAQTFSMVASGYARFRQALSLAGMDSRFSLKQSGPSLPRGRLAMY